MWENDKEEECLPHDMSCGRCGHALHTYLSCGDGCDCPPTELPGERKLTA
jgi:hypothetical protein